VKALLVSFYFPPAGGGGVQRPLKLAQYLPALGIETHVLAPDDPRWVHRDDDLRVPTQAWVHRARYIGPGGGKPAEALRGKEGLARAATYARLMGRRLLLPDENVSWNLTAIPAAIRLVKEHGIDVVITTSPPPSLHFVGAAVQRATGARWVADLRDSLVGHVHRRTDNPASRAKLRLHERLARTVAARADAVVGAAEFITEEVRALEPKGKLRTIANGCDFDDVAGLEYLPSDRMRITHAGSFFGKRDPRPFLQALASSELDLVARFLGDFRLSDRQWAESLSLGDRLELIPHVARAEALALQRDSEALLLLIPNAGGRGKGVLSGKVFEYIAVGRPILAAVPPDGAAAELIRETGSGIVAPPDDVDALRGALVELHGSFANGGLDDVVLDDAWRARLSRRARVEEFAELLRSL
jgi:glycosyltransferase involved in cell wall biosynthesis